jgi:hypothetical protein
VVPHLVIEANLREAHQRYRVNVIDQAGSFPALRSAGNANAIAERQGMETEEEIRLFK